MLLFVVIKMGLFVERRSQKITKNTTPIWKEHNIRIKLALS